MHRRRETQGDAPADEVSGSGPGDEDVVVADEAHIWQLVTSLSGALTAEEVALALAQEGAAAAGASFATVALLDGAKGRMRLLSTSALPPAIAAGWTDIGTGDPNPLCEAVRTGLPVLLESPAAMGQRYPESMGDAVAASLRATASLPLFGGDGDVLGAAGFGWRHQQGFDAAQVRRLDLIAQITAQALDRALLVGWERQQPSARDQAEAHLLQEAFLPRTLPRTASLELAAAHLPAMNAAMGGDWYDAFPVDGGMCLVIGDVAGHGLQAVSVMAQLRNAVRAFADEDPSPAVC